MSLSRGSRIASLAIVGALCLVTVAGAQQQRRGGGGGGGFGGGRMGMPGMDTLMLLRQEAVQKELKLSADQTTKLTEIATNAMSEMQEIFSGLQDLSPEERREQMQELRGEAEAKAKEIRGKVDGVLDAAQKDRLKQLSIQRRGAFGALQDPEVAAALKLTADQKSKLEAMVAEMRPGRGPGGGGGGGGGDREAMRERFQAMQKERNDKALGILTAEQKAELEKMQGAKFEFPAGGGRGGFPGA